MAFEVNLTKKIHRKRFIRRAVAPGYARYEERGTKDEVEGSSPRTSYLVPRTFKGWVVV